MPGHPRVFVSHSSADKERFVLPFAERLRERGVDAWVDQWEMLPGDSLVEKVFGGIDQAEGAIVVLSKHSLRSRWVREELNATVVKRIEERFILIPVVLDGLQPNELPLELRLGVLESVTDLSNLDAVTDRIVRAVHGNPVRPPLGPLPVYTEQAAVHIDGLDRIDSLVLKVIGERAQQLWSVRYWDYWFTTLDVLDEAVAALGISQGDGRDSLQVLHGAGLIDMEGAFGPPKRFRFTDYGVQVFARCYVNDYDVLVHQIVARLAGWSTGEGSISELVEQVGATGLIVEHAVEDLAGQRLLMFSAQAMGGDRSQRRFSGLSVRLRRMIT